MWKRSWGIDFARLDGLIHPDTPLNPTPTLALPLKGREILMLFPLKGRGILLAISLKGRGILLALPP